MRAGPITGKFMKFESFAVCFALCVCLKVKMPDLQKIDVLVRVHGCTSLLTQLPSRKHPVTPSWLHVRLAAIKILATQYYMYACIIYCGRYTNFPKWKNSFFRLSSPSFLLLLVSDSRLNLPPFLAVFAFPTSLSPPFQKKKKNPEPLQKKKKKYFKKNGPFHIENLKKEKRKKERKTQKTELRPAAVSLQNVCMERQCIMPPVIEQQPDHWQQARLSLGFLQPPQAAQRVIPCYDQCTRWLWFSSLLLAHSLCWDHERRPLRASKWTYLDTRLYLPLIYRWLHVSFLHYGFSADVPTVKGWRLKTQLTRRALAKSWPRTSSSWFWPGLGRVELSTQSCDLHEKKNLTGKYPRRVHTRKMRAGGAPNRFGSSPVTEKRTGKWKAYM